MMGLPVVSEFAAVVVQASRLHRKLDAENSDTDADAAIPKSG